MMKLWNITAILLCPTLLWAAEPLPSLNLNPNEVSLSGLSSGAYMAVQYHAVYSASVSGAGIIAGGPYHCIDNNADGEMPWGKVLACMTGQPDPAASVAKLKENAAAGLVDPADNMKKSRIYIYLGTKDSFMRRSVSDSLFDYYRAFLPETQIKYLHDQESEHAFITDNPADAACTTGGLPGVNNCAYDQAGDILQWIHGELKPRRQGPLSGRIINFDQQEFIAGENLSLGQSGYLYVPAECAAGQACKLHVVFHGCGQYANNVEDKVYGSEGAGYNRWADSNRMVVLYPQAALSSFAPANPFGCWDWWGYNDAQWDTRQGKQLRVIRAMVERLTAGRK